MLNPVLTITRPDPNLHECDGECVPCSRFDCGHCDEIHAGDDECRDTSCACSKFLADGDCEDCDGKGVEEFHVWGLGLTERRCSECVDGKVS